MPPQPRELTEELVEEVLIRIQPDNPASLVRAALVCKLWCRLVCGAAFRRRFLEFHRNATPLLGVVYTGDCRIRHQAAPRDTVMPAYFVPTVSIHPVHAADGRYGWRAMDARHGRVLLHRRSSCSLRPSFSVWDPVTDEQQDLPRLPFDTRHSYTAAVACAAAGGNCSHLDCRRGPFLVVVMDIKSRLSVYSSKAGAWSQPTRFECLTPNFLGHFARAPSVLVSSALYFLFHSSAEIVKYDLATCKVSKIRLPSKFHNLLRQRSIVLMTDDHGGLGFVASTEYQLELWSIAAGGDAGFLQTRVIDLVRLLPCAALIHNSPQVSGFAIVGASRFLFMRTSDGLYSLEINSSQVKKVANCCDDDKVVLPFVSFSTPTSRVHAQLASMGSSVVKDTSCGCNVF